MSLSASRKSSTDACPPFVLPPHVHVPLSPSLCNSLTPLHPARGTSSPLQFPINASAHRPVLLEYVMNDKMKSNAQLEGAFEYLKKVGSTPVDRAALEAASGVGVVVSAD